MLPAMPKKRPITADDLWPQALAPQTLGLKGNLNVLERELVERHGAAGVVRVTKPNYSAPAGDDILDRAQRWNALVAGIGD